MRSGPSWGKKDQQCDPCDPADRLLGSVWDHVAFKPDTKFAVTVIAGKRGRKNVRRAVEDFAARTNHEPPQLITTDLYKPYIDAVLGVYGQEQPVHRQHGRGRPPKPRRIAPQGMLYAAVHKHRRKGRVVRLTIRSIFGTADQIDRALQESPVSSHINTAFVERYNATDRHLNSRKGRKVYRFSKDRELHEAATHYTQGIYNFCRANRALTLNAGPEHTHRLIHRTPAMAEGITDHIWTIREFTCYQACAP